MKMQKEFAEDVVNNDAYIKAAARHYSDRFGIDVSPIEMKERLARFSDEMNTGRAVNNGFVEDLLLQTEYLAQVLLEKPWQIWRAPEGFEFITSDNPVISFVLVGNGQLSLGYGFRRPDVTVAFPVSPNATLAMGSKGPEFVTLNETQVKRLNEAMIRLCDRFVYSKMNSDAVRELVDAHGGTARYGENAFLLAGAKQPSVRDFLEHQLGLVIEPEKERSAS